MLQSRGALDRICGGEQAFVICVAAVLVAVPGPGAGRIGPIVANTDRFPPP